MRAKIKASWFPYGVGLEVEAEKVTSGGYKINKVFSDNRKNLALCKKKLFRTIICEKYLDFNYDKNMKDTIKTFRVKIKDNPNPDFTGKIANVSLYEKLEHGDMYQIQSFETEFGISPYCGRYYIMDQFLDFEITSYDGDEIDLQATNEYEAKPFEQGLNLNPDKILDGVFRKVENEKTRVYNSGAKRSSNVNKPFIHNFQAYSLLRFGYLTNMGAREHGDGNFLKGFPDENAVESLLRHITLFRFGDESEDHLASALFNIQLLMLNQEKRGIKVDHWFKKAE